MEDMTAERFFSFASRLVAYKGAIRMKAEEESERTSPQRSDRPNAASKSSDTSQSQGKKYYRDISHNPELAQYFD